MTNKTQPQVDRLRSLLRVVTPTTVVNSLLYELEDVCDALIRSGRVHPTEAKAIAEAKLAARLACAAAMVSLGGTGPIIKLLRAQIDQVYMRQKQLRVRFPRPKSAKS